MSRNRWLRRWVGVVVVAGGAGFLIGATFLVARANPARAHEPQPGEFLGWDVLYATDAPPLRLAVLAVAVAALLVSVAAAAEWHVATRYRRSVRRDVPLAPRRVMALTRGVFAGPVTVTVLIPAHNEEAGLGRTLAALLTQSQRPDRVVVVADNCTDGTVRVAREAGVEVVETVGNTEKKAGALNQVLRWVLPGMGDNDAVMVMDADTAIEPGFIAAAARLLADDRALMAVGGLFYGEPGHGLIGQFQRNEYVRYSRDLERRRGRVFVLTGTASIFRAHALRTVADARGEMLPGTPGQVYDTAALTEDNELTIALKSLGALTISPRDCRVVTELMPTWRALWNQRLRWQRGALENLGEYGVRPQTVRYWAQQLGIGYSVVALVCYLALAVIMLLAEDRWVWFPFWLGIGAFFAVERVWTVWRGGWRARVVAALVLPELSYAAFLDLVYVRGVIDIFVGRQAQWVHHNVVTPEEAA